MAKRTEPRNPTEIEHLRTHLESLMETRQLSPGELASKAIIPLSSLLRILDGTIKNPGLDVTLSLAKALGVTVSELLGDTIPQKDYTTFYIEGRDRTGLLNDITEVIRPSRLNIASSISTAIGQVARCVIHVEGGDRETLKEIRRLIYKEVPLIDSVEADIPETATINNEDLAEQPAPEEIDQLIASLTQEFGRPLTRADAIAYAKWEKDRHADTDNKPNAQTEQH